MTATDKPIRFYSDSDGDNISNADAAERSGRDVLSADTIGVYLCEPKRFSIEVYDTVGSTNSLLKERAADGAPEWSVIIASAQTAGRGRLGRTFSSPAGTGLYMSLLLRPGENFSGAATVTAAAAVAVCRAVRRVLEETAGPERIREPLIKWVNDVLIDGKKVAGILTEAALSAETGAPEYVVLGIGVNIYEPDGGFSEELRDIAGAVFDAPVHDTRSRAAAYILNEFTSLYDTGGTGAFIDEYRSRSAVVGRNVNVIKPSSVRPAYAVAIDDECRLIVRYEDGTEEVLSSSEVSVRTVKTAF